MQALWRIIWKHTLEKSQTNAISVTLHSLRLSIWRDIWKRTVEKSHTNATNVTMLPLRHAIWGSIWIHTLLKSKSCNLCHFASSGGGILRRHVKENSNAIKQPSWTQFEVTVDNINKINDAFSSVVNLRRPKTSFQASIILNANLYLKLIVHQPMWDIVCILNLIAKKYLWLHCLHLFEFLLCVKQKVYFLIHGSLVGCTPCLDNQQEPAENRQTIDF